MRKLYLPKVVLPGHRYVRPGQMPMPTIMRAIDKIRKYCSTPFRALVNRSRSVLRACVIMSLSLRLLRPAKAHCRVARLPSWRGYATVEVPASKLRFGQPLHETHPHLLKPGESTTASACLIRPFTKQQHSHTKHYCPRVLPASPKARRKATAKFDRPSCRRRPEVCFGRRLLQIPPGPRLPLPDR
jgi:hypothetical protein